MSLGVSGLVASGGYFVMEECDASCDSDNHSSLPPRSTKKRSFGNSLKKLLASALRGQVEWYTTPDLYRTSCDMFPENEDVDRGGENAPENALKNTPCNEAAESPEISSHKRPSHSDLSPKLSTPSGLENLGNTCYLNAILQCLRSTELVRDYCDNIDNVLCKQLGSNCDLFRTFAGLIRKMESVTNGSIGSNTILKFKNAFTRFVPCYGGNLQQDALEFFTYLLDGLHEEIKERPQTPVLDESTLPRLVSPVVSPSPSIVPTKCMRRCKLRMGGLKHSESSGKLTAASEKDVEIGFDSSDLDWAKPSIRKWLRARRPKVRAVSIRRNESILLDDICQPGLGSAETTATEKSFLKDTFVGHLQTQVRCLQCNNVTTRDELFWNLALCVPEVSLDKESKDKAQHRISSSSSAVDMSVSLDDCLCAFTKAEVLDDLDKLFCTKCKTLTRTQLQVMISRLPKILVLQFQRFKSTCCKTKKQHLINFHFEQDMAPYYVNGSTEKQVAAVPERASTLPKCTNSSASQQPVDSAAVNDVTSNSSTTPSASKADVTSASGSTNYRLYAVVYHQGGTQHGHYTARCHLPSPDPSTVPHSWFLFDDENVSHVPNSKDVIQSTAYILFYERIDKKVDGAAPSKPM
ncbi:Peptidase C19 ubiquitin carboxyl terminal hydrolase 2 [Echinococcus multilocularis]|uniref:Ubiquitin carboxyl-terminal hydrolase n=1 Tax=Echinococcus multilocularis TaxID=6211 RepID=A0A068Y1G5_ECHMU|nr:Peptidase C19 ubiquitin carboxyl terminal hydrolase 2 [Echinococcus multilocularis]